MDIVATSIQQQAPCSNAGVEADYSASRWPARLKLQMVKTGSGTRLVSSEHSGPLYVQRPFYPEGSELAHVYILHPPGGLVSGDDLKIDIHMGTGGSGLFTTPGAGRLYRARSDLQLQQQHVNLQLQPDSTLEWFPLENIVYPGAHAKLHTRVELADNSHFIGWEISCLGLPASDLPFDRGSLNQRFEIWRGRRPLLIENLRLDMRNRSMLDGIAGMAGRTTSGLLLAGPIIDINHQSECMSQIREIEVKDALLGATLVGDFIAVRYLGDCCQQARRLFTHCWSVIRPLLMGRPACLPRIWAT